MSIPPAVAVAMLPARSLALPLRLCPAPSVAIAAGAGHASASGEHVKATVTGAVYQPLWSGPRSTAAEIVGGTLSITIGPNVADETCPATSAPVALTSSVDA